MGERIEELKIQTGALKKARKEGKSEEVIKLGKAIQETTTKNHSSTNEGIRMEKGQECTKSIKEKGSSSSLVVHPNRQSFLTPK